MHLAVYPSLLCHAFANCVMLSSSEQGGKLEQERHAGPEQHAVLMVCKCLLCKKNHTAPQRIRQVDSVMLYKLTALMRHVLEEPMATDVEIMGSLHLQNRQMRCY